MTVRLAALTLASVLLVTSCSDSPSATAPGATSKPTIVSSGCADLIVLGARGQTQDVDKNRGVGTEVRVTAERLAALQNASNGGSTRIVAIRYDAAATATHDGYLARVADGAQLLVDRLSALSDRCPDSRFALIGFSEGAQVVHAAALELSTAATSRVGVIAMIADPRRNAQDAIAHWTYGGAEATRNGRLGAGTPLPAGLRPVAISLCVAEDEICNAAGSAGQAPSETHRTFYEKPSSATSSAEQLHRILQQ